MPSFFNQSQLQAISDALGDTSLGLTGSEIGHLLQICQMKDPDPDMSKRDRLLNAFVVEQNNRGDRTRVLGFIRKAMKPELYVRQPGRYEPLRENLNKALSFCGMAIDESGKIISIEKAQTLSEAQRRASELRADLEMRGVHPDVLLFCKEELLKENYFHAVLEATKSVAEKLRQKTGLVDDGAVLVDRALGGDLPLVAINTLATESEQSEQKGFMNLIKGVFGMFRNTTAHAPKISWAIDKEDAEEAFTVLSLIHKKIDQSKMPSRV